MLKNTESNAELKGFDVGSLVVEPSKQSSQDAAQNLTDTMGGGPST